MRVCMREPLPADRTYYVRTDGDDNNSGLVNDASGAFLTIQKAINVVSSDLDLALYACTVQVGAGTYTETVQLRPYLGTITPILRGDNATPANVTIAAPTGNAINMGGLWQIEGLKLTSTNANGLACANSAVVRMQNIEFGACASNQVAAILGGVVHVIGNYRVSGSAATHIFVDNGQVLADGRAVTVVNTPNFSQAFVVAQRLGVVGASGATFVGAATGVRYRVLANAVIDAGGGGANFFPGNAAGTATTGGQYL